MLRLPIVSGCLKKGHRIFQCTARCRSCAAMGSLFCCLAGARLRVTLEPRCSVTCSSRETAQPFSRLAVPVTMPCFHGVIRSLPCFHGCHAFMAGKLTHEHHRDTEYTVVLMSGNTGFACLWLVNTDGACMLAIGSLLDEARSTAPASWPLTVSWCWT